jgi:hypothetical protein
MSESVDSLARTNEQEERQDYNEHNKRQNFTAENKFNIKIDRAHRLI